MHPFLHKFQKRFTQVTDALKLFRRDPPIVNGSAENCYVGYFENPHGEKWVFILDPGTGKATLRGGDVGWNTQFDVTNGAAADLILGREEQLWLQACWSSAQKQVVRD